MKNPLMDSDFLVELDKLKNKIIYARVIVLDFLERPLEQIEGRVTSGSINIDGTSAVRRTCNLSLIAEQMDINNYYWGLNNKFKLEVGVENTFNKDYPEIVWFPQGIYVFTAINTSQSVNSYTLSISGKDKMCLLNGEISGSIPSSVDFGVMEESDYTYSAITFAKPEEYKKNIYYIYTAPNYILSTGEYNKSITYYRRGEKTKYTHIPIKDIIKNAVNVYGNEPLHNIVISDVEDYGVELLEYRGDKPIYLLRDINADIFRNMSINGDQQCQDAETGATYSLKAIPVYDTLIGQPTIPPTRILLDQPANIYTVVKLEYGTTAGYRLTDLTYPGELIASVGESLTSILDKIKSMLGTFEYFYDVDGRFVFQRKKEYVNTSWNTIVNTADDTYVDSSAYSSAFTYSFEDGLLVTAYQNTPNLQNLKNDFSIWGSRKGASGAEMPIHMRYALNIKPTQYRTINVEEGIVVDGRKVRPQVSVEYTTEKYDWRELIYRMALDYFQYNHDLVDFIQRVSDTNYMHYPRGYTGYESYYTDLQGFWRQLYDPSVPSDSYDKITFWHKNVDLYPETLNFWFDFLDVTETDLDKYSTTAIGARPKAINDSKITSIYFRGTPTVLFVTSEEYLKMVEAGELKNGYTYIQLNSSLASYFNISSQGISAQDKLDDLLYNHTYCIETISMTTLPVYYLSPNTRIFVKDANSKIEGEYVVSRMTLPLAYNGTMSISATKAVSRIY